MDMMNSIPTAELHIPIQLLAHAKDMALPAYGSAEAAGLDLCAAIDQVMTLAPGGRALVPTGVAIALPKGYEGQVRPRSGLALKHGITILNAPGTVDSDYRGEIGVILVNLGSEPFEIRRGDRIAQLVIAPYRGSNGVRYHYSRRLSAAKVDSAPPGSIAKHCGNQELK